MDDLDLMRHAIALARTQGASGQGGPFGAVIVKDGHIVAEGANQVTGSNDPTAHAEIVAIRRACARLGTFSLAGCEIFTSCEPCPMCLGAIYWARLDRIYFGAGRADAAAAGFDDDFLYRELPLSVDQRSIPTSPLLTDEARRAFDVWAEKAGPHSILTVGPRGIPVRFDQTRGKGSHGTLYYDDRFTVVKVRRKECGPGPLSKMLSDLGLTRDDLR